MAGAGRYEFVVALLLVIIVLELAARRLRLPPAVAFILGGTGLAVLPGVPSFSIDPDLVMLLFLPPLLMSGGYFTAWAEFRRNFGAIAVLAVGAVAFTTAAVGFVAHSVAPSLPWAACFALGAVVSPPDAVAASAVLGRLSLPSRLTATLEGESLLNDASGLVLFRFAIAAALTGVFNATAAAGTFVALVVGGVLLGFVAARLGLWALARLQDSQLAILASLLLPAATYIAGERLHVSGVLATVVAGIIVGRRQHGLLSAGVRIRMQAFWGVLVFLLESLLFILVGLGLREVAPRLASLPVAYGSIWWPVAAVTAATVVARLAWVYATWAGRRTLAMIRPALVARPSLAMTTVIGWAGMRGVVTLAAALSIPREAPGRDFVLVAAFAVILVTVLGQGATLGPLIRALGLSGADEAARREDSVHEAWARMTDAQHQAVAAASRQEDGGDRHPRLLDQYGRQARLAREFMGDPDTHSSAKIEHHQVLLRAIEAGRAEILKLHQEGAIHDEVLRVLEHELDLQQLVAEGRAT